MNEKKRSEEVSPEENDQIKIPLAELIKVRRAKAKQMLSRNVNPYPYRFERTHHINELHDNFTQFETDGTVIHVAGRVMQIRKMGKVYFADLQDSSGKMQIYVRKNDVGDELLELFGLIDLGDIIGCEGTVFVTRTGEQTIKAISFEILTKSLHPLPDKHHGLKDKETRYRRRYVDLIVNPEVRETFIKRTKIIQLIRDFLNSENFLEVETPILQPLYGGASARPFKTHHNTLDIPMYMRIADELYLKRLIVGGYDKVWELCKDFRNEGMDRLHNPEFSMIEMYWAFADYRDMAKLFEKMLRHTVHEMYGSYKIKFGEHEIDFEQDFKWISMIDSIKESTNIDFTELEYDDAKAAAKKIGVSGDNLINRGKVIEAVWEAKVEASLIQPTFVVDFPIEISPLAKRHRKD